MHLQKGNCAVREVENKLPNTLLGREIDIRCQPFRETQLKHLETFFTCWSVREKTGATPRTE